PPYNAGNLPRVELVFECVDKAQLSAPAPNAAKSSKSAQLKKQLDDRILTEQEFERQRAKILAMRRPRGSTCR
ncbi:MAG TPA: SHOCT domain-containing protein, partial [Steroidobacteraceae bacterium]